MRAQRGVRLFDDIEAIEDMDLGEIEMGLEERIEKWTDEIKAEGEAKGLAKGKAEGLAEGEAKGMDRERKRVARKLLVAGTPVAQIQEITGLSVDDIALLG
jgi:predicted transposase YdaD